MTRTPGRIRRATVRRAHRACGATCCCGSDWTDPARPTSWPTGSVPAGPASCSSSGRSSRPELVSRQTVRHGVGRPRHLYDVTRRRPGPLPDQLRRAGVRSAGRDRGGRRRRSARPGLRGPAAPARRHASASTWPSTWRRMRSLVDRVRELAVIQADQGYLADAILDPDGAIRLREHNCAIFHVALGIAGGLPGRTRAVQRSAGCGCRS